VSWDFAGKTAVLTGAGSGFGLECARIGARLGMNLVLADVQQDALDRAESESVALARIFHGIPLYKLVDADFGVRRSGLVCFEAIV
jgi:NAD(P)-dependent dehydrogenase (short-subunit alcohol dehydrogenase family)